MKSESARIIYDEHIRADRPHVHGSQLVSKALPQVNPQTLKEFRAKLIPRKFILDTINICNANCVFCAYQYNADPKTIMSLEMVQETVKQITELHPNAFISLTPTVGDPLIDPDIFKKVKICKELGVKRVQFYTNAILLKKRLPELLNSELDNLEISVSDLNSESYLKIFRSTKYDDVIQGISLLLKELFSSGKTLPVKINFRSPLSLAQIQESDDFKNFILPWITDFIHFSDTTTFDNWTGLIVQNDLPPGMKLAQDTKRIEMKPCSRLVDVQILANGDVRLCGCRMGKSANDDLVVGNLLQESLRDIWYSDKVGRIWENFLYQLYPKSCLNCSYYDAIDHRPDRHLQFQDE